MKRPYLLICVSLAISLFIYLFYRTDNTVINELFIYLFSYDSYQTIKLSISGNLNLSNNIIYSLPEGLWVLAATMASSTLFIPFMNKRLNITFFPLIVAVALEFGQFLQLTNGTFDTIDLLYATFFSLAGYLITRRTSTIKESVKQFNMNSCLCLSTYLVVYLAHVGN